MLRLFFAVRLPPSPALLGVLAELRATGERVKVVDGGGMHATLKFLGDTPEAKLAGVVSAARASVSGGPFTVRVKGTGAFGGRGRPSVLWAGIEDDGSLARLAGALDSAMSPLGYARERRPFSPHLTLARARDGSARLSQQVMERHGGEVFSEGEVREVVLFRSELSPAGPNYKELARFPLC